MKFATRLLWVLIAAAELGRGATLPRGGDELRFCVHGAPRTLDPLQASDSSSELIRMLTSGSLVRVDRRTQQISPELAVSWKTSPGNREVVFTLRPGVRFSDGTPLTADDVVFTMKKILDPALKSPLGDVFRFGAGQLSVEARGAGKVAVTFPKPLPKTVALFENVPVLSARSPQAVAGAYMVASYKAGSEIVLTRNPHYWKRDVRGTPLPYVSAIRVKVQANREAELLEFERGEVDLIPELTAEMASRLALKNPAAVVDLGLTLDMLVLWFNQVPGAPLPDYKKRWFQSVDFRKALSLAMNREDICRIAYQGKARPGVGPVSPANAVWYNQALKADPNDVAGAMARLQKAGFTLRGGVLYDSAGNRVEFSAVTNAGSKTHERVLGLIQQDWKKIGVKLTVVTLDFPSVIERITRSYNYESCLLPLTNISAEPDEQMNIYLSSAANHQWNPSQSAPATLWESEIDQQLNRLAGSFKHEERKKAFDRVQLLAAENAGFLYVVHPRAQAAVGAGVKLKGAPTWPYLLWGLEEATVRR